LRKADEIEKRDWVAWHRAYDERESNLARRLGVVQEQLRLAIDAHQGRLLIISMCAGEGRDVIPVLASHPRRHEISARLVELDERNAAVARASIAAEELGESVEMLCSDAAITDSYADAVPAEIILACGVFGNITDSDIEHTIGVLPALAVPNATVIWTRGRERDRDIPGAVRRWFGESGFEEVAFVAQDDAFFTVGVHRLAAAPLPFEPGVAMFRFVR